MIKLMIVDDEQIVRDGIKFIIENNFKDQILICAYAKSGREAIEKYEEHGPHIVLMDIQMPGINGIDAIEAIQEMNNKVKFVIVSAYEQFEYAKSAVQLGVKDYILKPINKKRLIEVVDNLVKHIIKERNVKQREIETQEKLEQILPVLEHGYIYSILMNDDYQKENIDYYSLLGITKEYGYVYVIELGDGSNPNTLENKIGSGVKNNYLYQTIRRAIKFKIKSIVGPLIVNRIIVLVFEDMPENEYSHRIKSIESAESIQMKLEEITDSKVYIGIGSCYRNHRLNLSYNEAIKALSKITDEKVLHIKDAVISIKEEKAYTLRKIKSDEESISRKVEEGNFDKVDEMLKEFFAKLHRDYVDNITLVKNVVMELMVLVSTSAYRNGIYSDGDQSYNYLEDVYELSSFYEMRNWCITKTLSVTDQIKREKKSKVSDVIAEAMTYIENNYSKDIRLKDIAEEVSISPQYFSKIFKEELGVNFIDYLTSVRMSIAKELLKSETKSIKEICYEIGYNDPNYFSRLFKKLEGKSPSEWEESI